MEDEKIRVAITHGDTNGIGYELIFKTFAEPEMLDICTPIIYGSPKIAAYYRKALDIEANFSIISKAEDAQSGRVNLLTCFDEEIKVEMGKPTPESGQAAMKALDRAMTDHRQGLFDVLVTLPVDQGNTLIEGTPFPGMCQYLETCLGEGKKPFALYCAGGLRVAVALDAVAMKDVHTKMDEETLSRIIRELHLALRRDMRIDNPRIAVLGYNADANGSEETELLKPLVSKMAQEKAGVFGPYPAAVYYGEGQYEAFDATLAIYHDQGVLPLSTLATEPVLINYCGLASVCTSVAGTPGFDIAGEGKADPLSLRQAIYTAIDTYRNRSSYDEPYANPLPKLFHEKRDESEKVRFSIPKKKEE